MINEVLKVLPFAKVSIDDVVVISTTLNKHISDTKKVGERKSEYSLKIKLIICFFAQDSTKTSVSHCR